MRSFEERIAEINRRSEIIIKERKKRRQRILTACIPVVLGTTLLIALFPRNPTTGESPNSRDSIAKVIVVGDDYYRYRSGKKNVTEIYDQLQAFEQHENKEESRRWFPSQSVWLPKQVWISLRFPLSEYPYPSPPMRSTES